MATHTKQTEVDTFFFVTFTCHQWLPLIEKSNLYSYFPFWFSKLAEKGLKVCGFVLMPNHIHLLVYVSSESEGLNKVISSGKRFLAYEIVKRLKANNEQSLLEKLNKDVSLKEKSKNKKHQVFKLSFDAKELNTEEEIISILDYVHHNPVNNKWSLVEDFTEYDFSSAKFYELEYQQNPFGIFDYRKTMSSESSVE